MTEWCIVLARTKPAVRNLLADDFLNFELDRICILIDKLNVYVRTSTVEPWLSGPLCAGSLPL